jgi:hypothetical protein
MSTLSTYIAGWTISISGGSFCRRAARNLAAQTIPALNARELLRYGSAH